MNGVYQLFSPIIVVLILLILGAFASLYGLTAMYATIIGGIIVIVIFTIFFNVFFKNQDNFILEIAKFFSYYILVVSAQISFVGLAYAGVITTFELSAMIVVVFVSSLHLRLLKYDNIHSRFTYNKSIIRNQDIVTKKTIKYPDVSSYFLYRIELYIVLILCLRIVFLVVIVDVFIIFFITILLDIIIYLILSKFTKLLQPHKSIYIESPLYQNGEKVYESILDVPTLLHQDIKGD
jgi:hypothetical protein